ncbi:MAG TPA: hypothetical protein VN648_33465 [Candidatus Methylomirabilis sp.]|nr:hypothetical protein [Candidatus Methylomirabilis sp.]
MQRMRTKVGFLAVGILLVMGGGRLAMAQGQNPEKQSVAGGGVTVAVTFLKGRTDAAAFQVLLDTHSVNLDVYRFEDIVRLRDGKGSEAAPVAVEGVKGSGHHREATVRFAWPDPKPNNLELVVKGVAGVPERVFRWALR